MAIDIGIMVIFDGEKEAIKKLLDSLEGKEGFDFNKLIPMPESVYKGPLGIEEMTKYKENNWYDWGIKNWGTKWNCYEQKRLSENEIKFMTANSVPIPILEKLAEICARKNINFDGLWAAEMPDDRDSGSFEAKNGILSVYPDEDTEDSRNTFITIWGIDPEEE